MRWSPVLFYESIKSFGIWHLKALANIPWLDRVGKKVCGMKTIEATDRNKKETGHCKLDAEQTQISSNARRSITWKTGTLWGQENRTSNVREKLDLQPGNSWEQIYKLRCSGRVNPGSFLFILVTPWVQWNGELLKCSCHCR